MVLLALLPGAFPLLRDSDSLGELYGAGADSALPVATLVGVVTSGCAVTVLAATSTSAVSLELASHDPFEDCPTELADSPTELADCPTELEDCVEFGVTNWKKSCLTSLGLTPSLLLLVSRMLIVGSPIEADAILLWTQSMLLAGSKRRLVGGGVIDLTGFSKLP